MRKAKKGVGMKYDSRFPDPINYIFVFSGDYICELETYGEPIDQTNKLDVLGKFFPLEFSTSFAKVEK